MPSESTPSSPSPAEIEAAVNRVREIAGLLEFDGLAYFNDRVGAARRTQDVWAIRVLLAEQEAARRDRDDDARFAWLERHPLTVPMQHHGDGWRVVSCDRLEVFHGPTLRDAIDAAIQSTTTGADHV